MYRGGGKHIRVVEREQRRQRTARGHASHVHAGALKRDVLAGRLDHFENDGALAVACGRVRLKPVPATANVRKLGLIGIEHGKSAAVGNSVHARAALERLGAFTTAVDHHHQRQRLAVRNRRWHIESIGTLGRQQQPRRGGTNTAAGDAFKRSRIGTLDGRQLGFDLRFARNGGGRG